MPKPFDNYGEKWWRFSEVELRNGYLEPASGAELIWYDPWEEHRRWLQGDGASPLDRLLAVFGTTDEQIPPASAVLEWSQAFGPLGILLYRTVYVVFPPLSDDAKDTWIVDDLRFVGGWFRGSAVAPDRHDREWLDERAARAVLRSEILSDRKQPDAQPIAETWGPYFPHVARDKRPTFAYPRPGEGEGFARLYREPFIEWVHWAHKVVVAVQLLRSETTIDDRFSGDLALSTLAAPITQALDIRNPAAMTLRHRSPALLSSLAMMAMQDLGGGAMARTCKAPDCSVTFITSNARAEYHDNKCRWRHHKAVQRAAAKPKRKRATKRRTSK